MSKIYEPDSQYLERLEWQLSSEHRRANRLKSSSGKIAISRRVAAVSLAIGVLMTGVAMTKAADYIRDSWRKKIEIARVETEVELQKVHLKSIREMTSEAKMRAEEGLIREDEYKSMAVAVQNAELDFQRSMLNLEEVKMSGDIPRNELYAPMVGGRDFVSERLEIDKKAMVLNMEQLKIQSDRLTRLAAQNLIQKNETDQIQAEMANRKMMIDKTQERLDLRTRFLAREITAQEVEIADRTAGAERNLQLAQSRVESLRKQMERMEALEGQGSVSHKEVMQLQYALDAAQAELKLASLEMEVLEKLK